VTFEAIRWRVFWIRLKYMFSRIGRAECTSNLVRVPELLGMSGSRTMLSFSKVRGTLFQVSPLIVSADVCGKLEGERIVGSSVQGNPELLRYRVEPLQPSTSMGSIPWESLQDWREPIRRTLKSKSENANIHISAAQPKSARSLRVRCVGGNTYRIRLTLV
jgi:hypothetical protein